MIPAFHLPDLRDPPTTPWSYGEGESGIELRVPQLSPELLSVQIDALIDARDRFLARRPVASVVGVVDSVAARLLDRDDPLRRSAEAALPQVTGSSLPMVRHVLDRMASDWRAPRLEELLRSELGDPAVLDGFVPRTGGGGRTLAIGPRLAMHVFSGNIPGIAVTSLIRSLLVKSATLGKTAIGDPVLPVLFARGIAEADAELGSCLAVTYWPGGDEELERVALGRADVVVVYGGQEALSAVRARTPDSTRFLGYGQKISFGIVARQALTAEGARSLAEAAALEVATFDQQGCVSPHLFHVETGGEVTPEGWAGMLAQSLERLERELPRGRISPGEASAIRQVRGDAEFSQLSGSGVALHASPGGTAWTVVYDPAPGFAASCLNRVVRVKPVREISEAVRQARSLGSLLQTVGVAGPPSRLEPVAEELARAGASRVAPIGRMAWPPPWWHHDGRPPLRELLRWCDWE